MKETIKNIKKVYQYGKEYKKHLFGLIFAVISSIVVGLVVPVLTAKQIVYFTSSLWHQLFLISLIILGVQAYISFAAMFFTRRNSHYFQRGTMKNLQIELGREILKISQKDMDTNSSGMFIQRIINDTEKMTSFIGWGSLNHIRHILTNIGALLVTFFINRQVFLYYLLISIVLTVLQYEKTKQKGKKDIEFRNQTENVSGLVGELIRGSRDIKMLNSKESFMKKLEGEISIQNQKRFDMSKINRTYVYIIETLKAIMEFGLVVLLIYLVKNNTITIAIALALYNYKSGIMNLVMENISALLDMTKDFNISCDRVFSIIDNKEFEKETFGKKHLDKIEGNFEFKNVTFSYDEKRNVLNDLSFKINSGDMVGFVGKSGAGKTTIFNLLCKMYNVQNGEITIDGYNINDLDEESIRGNITIISQNPYIFNLSIRNNLKLVKENVTDEEIYEACRLACLDDFIEGLPNKYDTVVGESGIILSGGQKQRLAIARALIQKTKIILFDEATSSLDNETQFEIQKAISNLKEQYTILIIAHRLSTIVNCNKIMLLEDGRIVDEGTHQELLDKSNTYQLLYNTEMIK